MSAANPGPSPAPRAGRAQRLTLTLILGAVPLGLTCGADDKDVVQSAADAPFALAEVRASLWAIGPENDEEEGLAILLLSTAEDSCNDLSSARLGNRLDFEPLAALVSEGEGLLFAMYYERDTRGDTGLADLSEFKGLWSSYLYGVNPDGETVERLLYAFAFSQGYLMLVSGYYGTLDGSVWLRVDEIDDEGVSGAYATNWWWGDFNAEFCGAWETVASDSDWDY